MTTKFWVISKTNECNSTEIDKADLTDQTKFRLNEIAKIEDYFNPEINQRKSCSKNLSKYVTTFDYLNKVLIVLSAKCEKKMWKVTENVKSVREKQGNMRLNSLNSKNITSL